MTVLASWHTRLAKSVKGKTLQIVCLYNQDIQGDSVAHLCVIKLIVQLMTSVPLRQATETCSLHSQYLLSI